MRDNSISSLKNAFPFSLQLSNRDINDKNDYVYIVTGPAYKDFSPRTLKGISKNTVNSALGNLSDAIFDYIHNSNTSAYNTWHSKTCNAFINDFSSNSGLKIEYGKAQKIVNMTMKYLFCFRNAVKYKNKFNDCHMPLDSYTLNWFGDEVSKYDTSIKKGKIPSWSNLKEGDVNAPYTYFWIQNKIKEFLKSPSNTKYINNNIPLTSFEAEFYIWPEQQFIQQCNSLNNLDVFKAAFPINKDTELEKECADLISRITTYKNKLI